MEIHANFFENRNLSQNDSFVKNKLLTHLGIIARFCFKNEQLIGLLLILDQYFTTNDSKKIFVWTYLHSYHLIWLS